MLRIGFGEDRTQVGRPVRIIRALAKKRRKAVEAPREQPNPSFSTTRCLETSASQNAWVMTRRNA
jgi:hypothetical protein